MAYHNHLSQDLPLHHFNDQTNQQLSVLQDPLSSSSDPASKPDPHRHNHTLPPTPNWLNNALLRTQNPHSHYSSDTATSATNTNFLNLHTSASDHSPASHSSNQWLSSSILRRNHSDVIDDVTAAGEAMIGAATLSHESAELKNNGNGGGEGLNKSESGAVESRGGGDHHGVVNWQNARCKAEILAHPLYEQLLSAHVACLRIATPVDQLPRIDAQLAQSQNVVAKYSSFGHGGQPMVGDDKEVDQFMVC